MTSPSLQQFFKHFPDASIVVAGWDREEKMKPIQKHWSEFTISELEEHNLKYKRAIYFTPCDMQAPAHTIQNHKAVRAWYCDIDVSGRHEDITEAEREERKSSVLGEIFVHEELLPPSFIVETRNGFHVYWLAWPGENTLELKRYFDWIEVYLVKKTKGDEKAAKLVQLMRLPGFYNWKEEKGFPCRILPQFNTLYEYVLDDWEYVIGELVDKKEMDIRRKASSYVQDKKIKRSTNPDDIFEKAKAMPQEQALMKFSGTEVVNGEVYSLHPVMGGRHLNIYINGKLCTAFINLENNTLMCKSGGGRGSPNIMEWLKWYNPIYEREPSRLAVVLNKYLT